MSTPPKKTIRLKCFHNNEIRVVRLRDGTSFTDLKERLNEDYGFDVLMRYEDVWNSSGKCVRTMRNHRGAVHSISFLEEEGRDYRSSRIVSGSADANVRLWNIREGRCMKILRGHKAPVKVVCWPTESKVVSGARDLEFKRVSVCPNTGWTYW